MPGEIITAVPGSGKTRWITEKIIGEISAGTEPEKIYAVTFTRDAASEMKNRIGNDNVRASTIHSLAYGIISGDWSGDPTSDTFYDDMINESAERLSSGKCTIEVDVLCIDEGQDLSTKHTPIIHEMAKRAKKIFIVGDPKQSIFGFGGADSTIMRSLASNYKLSEKKLSKSHRIPSLITSKINAIFGTDIEPVRIGGSFSSVPINVKAWKDYVHAQAVESKSLPGTTAVLLRSNKEILDILRTTTDKTLYEYIMPLSGHPIACFVEALADLARGECRAYTLAKGMSLFNIPRMTLSGAFSKQGVLHTDTLLNFSTLESYVLRGISKGGKITTGPQLGPGQHNALKQALGICRLYMPQGITSVEEAVDTILTKLSNTGIRADSAWNVSAKVLREAIIKRLTTGEDTHKRINPGAPVTISTIHGAKGLEYDNVIYAVNRFVNLESEEEWNVAYVAMSRAKGSLSMGIPDAPVDAGHRTPKNLLYKMQTKLHIL